MPRGESSVIIRPPRTNPQRPAVTDTLFANITWHSPDAIEIPAYIRPWLLDPESLTAKLRQHTDQFNVQVLRHGHGALSKDENLLLGEHAQTTQVREVLLCAGNAPWVFARSLIPEGSSRDTTLNELQNIGNKPLGEALFDTPAVTRGPFQIASFRPEGQIAGLDKSYPQNFAATKHLWGRRRAFFVGTVPVIVAEVFLHQAPCYKELC